MLHRRKGLGFALVVLVLIGAVLSALPIYRVYHRWSLGPEGAPVIGDDVIRYTFREIGEGEVAPAPWKWRAIVGTVDAVVEQSDLFGENVLRVRSHGSHYVLWNQTRTFDPTEYRYLRWSWNAVSLPAGGDVRTHKEFYFSPSNKNDKALQILVGFEGDHVLMYVWDSTAPVGTEAFEWSPVAKIATIVVQSGPERLHRWTEHTVDILEDYRRRFGQEPTRVLGISIQTNANHTHSKAEGLVSPIEVRKRR